MAWNNSGWNSASGHTGSWNSSSGHSGGGGWPSGGWSGGNGSSGGSGGWGDKKATSPSGSDSGSNLHKHCTRAGCTYHLSSCPVAVTPPPSTGGSGHGSPMSAISLSSGGSHKSPIYLSSGGTVYMGSSSSSKEGSPAAYQSGGGSQDTSKMSTSERYLYESGRLGSGGVGASGNSGSGRVTTGRHRDCRGYICQYNEMSCPNLGKQ